MRLNPAATKASSNLKDVRSSTVQPKTFPPNASGATSNPELPKLRLLISFGGPRFSNRAIISIKTPAKLGVDAFLNRTHVRAAHDDQFVRRLDDETERRVSFPFGLTR